jgi:antitoxin ParD1/3/4
VPTRNIVLTHEQDEFVESIVRAGEYQDANEAIRDALRVFQQRRQENALKLEALRALIRAGANALEKGEFTEVEDSDLVRFLEILASRQGGSGS